MRRYLFERRDEFAVFFDEFFHRTHGNALFLQGKEKGGRIGLRSQAVLLKIANERIGNFLGKIQYLATAAFACDGKGIIFKVKVVDIQPDAFRNTDARAEKQRDDSKVQKAY